MSEFINIGNIEFASVRKGEYIDKSAMIQPINETLDTELRFSCVTRCRRFGKSMAARMLYAYYDKSCDSRHLFQDLAIAKMPSFEEHLNKYPTIYVDMSDFSTQYKNNPDIIQIINRTITKDILKQYPDINVENPDDLMDTLFAIADHTKERFIMIIDEWDIICRDFENVNGVMDQYVDWLRRMFKGGKTGRVFIGVYMTGILPIKKYNTESALNNFVEYSMVKPGKLAASFGFTHDEVEALCHKHNMDISEMERWYDGYIIGSQSSIFNPFSVIRAIRANDFTSYWQSTASYEKVTTYIQLNYDGLKDDIIAMLSGGSVAVSTSKFENDIHIIKCKDDVLTLLIHLGYLSYNPETRTCRIPNKEVADAFTNAVEDTAWTEIVRTIQNSHALMLATWDCDEQAVAQAIDLAHQDNTSILSYNNENSLSCVLSIAYIWARNEYIIAREFATGKGFADLVLIPRRNSDKPAIIIELKYNTAVNTAIDQIHNKNYPAKIQQYTNNLLLVGISYDKEHKTHSCRIERC